MATPLFLNVLYLYSYPESGKTPDFTFMFVCASGGCGDEGHGREKEIVHGFP